MKYFTMNEFTDSTEAKSKGINNTPTQLQKNNVVEMVNNLLDPLREDWGEYCKNNNLGTPALRVTSGIRSEALNKVVGGSKTSAHCLGYGVDLVPYNGKLLEFKNFCINWLKNKQFDQFISEAENFKHVPRWIHIGYKNITGLQRKQYMYTLSGNTNKFYLLKIGV